MMLKKNVPLIFTCCKKTFFLCIGSRNGLINSGKNKFLQNDFAHLTASQGQFAAGCKEMHDGDELVK